MDLDSTAVQQFEASLPKVLTDSVLRIQGYPDLSRVRPRVRAAVDNAIAQTLDALEPAVTWRRVGVASLDEHSLRLQTDHVLHCPVFKRFLGDSTHVVVAVFTIGARFDKEVEEALAGDNLLQGVLMENAGWLAVEGITREYTQCLRDRAVQTGQRLTRRMSPGYEYQHGETRVMWELEQQQALFEVFGEASVPVRLLESSAMLPKMSRSGLIGLRPPRSSA